MTLEQKIRRKLLKLLIKCNACNLYGLFTHDDLHNIRFENDKYRKCKSSANEIAINKLKKKKRINVIYILYTVSMWQCDVIYDFFEKDSRYTQKVIVAHKDGENKEEYTNTIRLLKDRGLDVVGVDDIKKSVVKQSDVIFFLFPYKVKPKYVDLPNIHLNKLTIYIPYAFHVEGTMDGFNNFTHLNVWRFYTESLTYKELMSKNSDVGDAHIRYVGYPKMDVFYNKEIPKCNIWKEVDGAHKKRIVYAPHYSVGREEGYATFDRNYMAILNLARKHKDSTTWVIKPHPLLRQMTVETGLFENEAAYEQYLTEWESLENASVMESGMAYELFMTSDALILDSASFTAEYQYAHRPILFLRSEKQKFNSFGAKVFDAMYKCDSRDVEAIDSFITSVVIGGNDYMKEKRNELFNGTLDYYSMNGNMTASEAIYKEISDTLK